HGSRAAGGCIDVVGRVGGVRLSVRPVAAGPVHDVGDRVFEEQLTGVHGVAPDVDLEVDVWGAAGVPAGVDRYKARLAVAVGLLMPAQVALLVGRGGRG